MDRITPERQGMGDHISGTVLISPKLDKQVKFKEPLKGEGRRVIYLLLV